MSQSPVMNTPKIKLTYFNFKGRGEAPRLALIAGGIPFEDHRISPKEFQKMRQDGELPFGQVPVMTVDGELFAQNGAILRYCGTLGGLYPKDDPITAMRIDEAALTCEDVVISLFKYFGPDKEKLKAAREECAEKDIPRLFGGLEKIVKRTAKSEEWLCGESISIADVSLYFVAGRIMNGELDHIPTTTMDSYPRLLKSWTATHNHPKIREWNKKNPWVGKLAEM